MKLFDKLFNFLGLDSEEEELSMEEEKKESKYPVFGAKRWEERKERTRSTERPSIFGSKKHDDAKVVSMPLAQTQVKVIVVEPVNFDDAQKVADYLRKNQPVVVNFEDTDSDVMKRIVDFVSGTIYALNGSMKKIGRNIMVCAPQNVDIDAGDATVSKTTKSYLDRSDAPWER